LLRSTNLSSWVLVARGMGSVLFLNLSCHILRCYMNGFGSALTLGSLDLP
jgi:hypothetical protein